MYKIMLYSVISLNFIIQFCDILWNFVKFVAGILLIKEGWVYVSGFPGKRIFAGEMYKCTSKSF